ncbi:MAG: hypothetical protein IJY62_04470 [Clostridia bacterium]|nr:hypothetical protein [Clostridia bacterium]
MDARITKKRLNLLLSYDWLKMIALIVAAIVLWSLIFTTAATRITPAQQFTIFNYSGTHVTTLFDDLDGALKKKNVFSYDILNITPMDATAGQEQAETLIQTRLMTNEGDALFVSGDERNKNSSVSYTDEQGNTFSPTYLQQFLTMYTPYAKPIYGEDGYISEMEAFLGEYYGDFRAENASINKEKVEEVFRARIKKQKDKRFKKEKKIKAGIQSEIERIEKYRDSLLKFESYVAANYVSVVETTVYSSDYDGNVTSKTASYSINLCPNQYMENLKELVYYTVSEKDAEGVTHDNVYTAQNIHLVLLDTAKSNYAYSLYESLSLVNYLVERYCSALNS